MVGRRAGVRDGGAGDFEHKGRATSEEVVSRGLRVGVGMVIGSGRVDWAGGRQGCVSGQVIG